MSGWGRLRIPKEELGSVAGEKNVWKPTKPAATMTRAHTVMDDLKP